MIFAFDDLELDTDALELRQRDQRVPLEPQTFGVLLMLVENAARVVPKEELLDAIWGSRFVSESTLTTRIKQARKAIGDDGRSQRLIRTAHGRGYRFVGELREVGGTVDARREVGSRDRDTVGDDDLPRLLERTAQLDALVAALDRAVGTGRGGVVLVAGEAGIGKTSLVQAFVATTGSARTLAGGCEDLVSPRPLGPIRDLARAAGPPLADAFAAGGDPDAVLAATLDLLAAGPTVLVVEDAHWADDATLDLVRLVGRRIDDLPALLLLTYRDDELGGGHPLQRVLGSFGGRHVTRLALPPLSTAAIAELAAGTPTGDGRGRSADEIHRTTRGNPFFVTEVLAAPDDQVPPTVRDAVLSRLSGLSPAARQVVELVSVVPSRTEHHLLVAADPDHLDALAEAEAAGVVLVDREHVWFRHELARRAVEASLPIARQLQLNRAVLDALAARPDTDPARLVHHARHAGDTDRMLEFAAVAADRALGARAYRQTMDFVTLLLDHEDRLPPAAVVDVLVRQAYALYVLNRLEESAEAAHRAVEAATGDADRAVAALLILSRGAYWAEGPSVAAACVHRALDLLAGAEPDERLAEAYADLARAHSNLVNVGSVAEPDGRVVDAAARSLAVADALGRADLESHALQYLGSGRLALGDPAGLADLERAVVVSEVDPRDELPVRACVNAAGSRYRAGDLEEAERIVVLGLDRAAGGDFFAGQYRLDLTRAGIWLSSGRWADAAELLVDLTERPGQPGIMRPLARTLLVRLRARQGHLREAEEVVAVAERETAASDEVHVLGPVAAARLELDWLAGHDGVPPLVDRALAVARRERHRTTEAELVVGLRRAGHRAEPELDEPPGPYAAALAGDHDAAAAAWDALGNRYEAAVERTASPDPAVRAAGARELAALGATATLAAINDEIPAPGAP